MIKADQVVVGIQRIIHMSTVGYTNTSIWLWQHCLLAPLNSATFLSILYTVLSNSSRRAGLWTASADTNSNDTETDTYLMLVLLHCLL